MDKTCDYWIDCDKPATVTITFKVKGPISTATHRHYLCDECKKTIHENLPNKAFDLQESVIE